MTDTTEDSMTDIREFTPGTSAQRGAITVHRYPQAAAPAAFQYDHDEFWQFTLPLADADEIWIRLHKRAVDSYQTDGTILEIASAELLGMALLEHPDGALADGRELAGLAPHDLYAPVPE